MARTNHAIAPRPAALAPLAVALLAGLLGGCNFGSMGLGGAYDQPQRVFVQSLPSAVNWDADPGPDGLEVTVYFFVDEQKLSVPVNGAIEFTLYEGKVDESAMVSVKPFRSWRFAGDDLRACQIKSMVGQAYAMRLPWGKPPATTSVTLAGRHVAPGGQILPFRPMVIPVGQN